MRASDQVYRYRHSIPVLFDFDDPEQAALFEVLKHAFRDEYAIAEDLYPFPHRSLLLLPGGLWEAQQ